MRKLLVFLFAFALFGCDAGDSVGPPDDPPDDTLREGDKPSLWVENREHLVSTLWDTRRPVEVEATAFAKTGLKELTLRTFSGNEEFETIAEFASKGGTRYTATFIPRAGDTKLQIRAVSHATEEFKEAVTTMDIPIQVADGALVFGIGRSGSLLNVLHRSTLDGEKYDEIHTFDSFIETIEALDSEGLWYRVETKDQLCSVYYDGSVVDCMFFDGYRVRDYEEDVLLYTRPVDGRFQTFWGDLKGFEEQLTFTQECEPGEPCLWGGSDPVALKGEIFVVRAEQWDDDGLGGRIGKVDPVTHEIELVFKTPYSYGHCSPYDAHEEAILLALDCSRGVPPNREIYTALYNPDTDEFTESFPGIRRPRFLDSDPGSNKWVVAHDPDGNVFILDRNMAKIAEFPTLEEPFYQPVIEFPDLLN